MIQEEEKSSSGSQEMEGSDIKAFFVTFQNIGNEKRALCPQYFAHLAA